MIGFVPMGDIIKARVCLKLDPPDDIISQSRMWPLIIKGYHLTSLISSSSYIIHGYMNINKSPSNELNSIN